MDNGKNYLSRVLSTSFDKALRRVVKVLRLGNSDAKTALEASPFGIDSNPLAGMVAVYAETQQKGRNTIIGYLNLNQLSGEGETRIFSADPTGPKFYIWLKNDGTCQMNGVGDNLVRFQALETGFNKLKEDFNNFLTHVHGNAGTPPTPPAVPSTADISGAKIDAITTTP